MIYSLAIGLIAHSVLSTTGMTPAELIRYYV